MSESSKTSTLLHFCCHVLIFLTVIFSSRAEYQNTNNWESFKLAHVLNPAVESESNYLQWTTKDWRHWFSMRKPLLERAKSKLSDTENSNGHKPLKHIDAVIISNPSEVLSAFTGTLKPYGRRNQAAVWSNTSFKTFVIQRAGKVFHVYNCGKMFIAARLFKGEPVHLQDYYPETIRNSFGGHLLYPVSRNCQRVYTPDYLIKARVSR